MDQPTAPPDRWVFGYGSLMWRPGFKFAERRRARLDGFRRAFCIYSVHHRGTPERRGLVLGLAEGGYVIGAAYRVLEPDWNETYEYLREREQPTETYVEDRATVTLDDGRAIDALIFLSDKTHPQWAGVLELSVQAQMIAEAKGLSGRNVDYLRDLVDHLRLEKAGDEAMETLLAEVEALQGRATSLLNGSWTR